MRSPFRWRRSARQDAALTRLRGLLTFADTPIDLQILGRTLLHACLVGLGAGLIGAGFFAALEYMQRFVLEGLAGYLPLGAEGEQFLSESGSGSSGRTCSSCCWPRGRCSAASPRAWRPRLAAGAGTR